MTGVYDMRVSVFLLQPATPASRRSGSRMHCAFEASSSYTKSKTFKARLPKSTVNGLGETSYFVLVLGRGDRSRLNDTVAPLAKIPAARDCNFAFHKSSRHARQNKRLKQDHHFQGASFSRKTQKESSMIKFEA